MPNNKTGPTRDIKRVVEKAILRIDDLSKGDKNATKIKASDTCYHQLSTLLFRLGGMSYEDRANVWEIIAVLSMCEVVLSRAEHRKRSKGHNAIVPQSKAPPVRVPKPSKAPDPYFNAWADAAASRVAKSKIDAFFKA